MIKVDVATQLACASELGRESEGREIGYGLSWARISPPLLASVWTFT